MNKALLRRDIALILAILAAALAIAAASSLFKKEGEAVEVRLQGELYARLSLSKNRQLDVEGLCLVVVKDGEAYIAEATCRNKICQNHSPISRAGETIACLPNGITVKVTSEGGADFYV